jgi:pyruvate-formate lyase-activating enzyme
VKLKSLKDPKYIYVDWWLMNHCNYSCSYCPDILKKGNIDLPDIDKTKKLVDQFSKFALLQGKVCDFYFTGGEVTQWFFLEDLLQHAKSYNNKVRLRTNASLPVNKWQSMLPCIDYVNLEFHTEHTNIAHFMLILGATKRSGVPCSITVSMLPDRWTELEEMVNKIKTFWPDQHVHKKLLFEDPAINKKPKEYTEPQTVKLKRQSGDLIYYDDSGEEEFTDYQTLVLENKNAFYGRQCMAGIEQFIVDAWGRVYRGHCRQGGSVGNVDKEILFPTEPVTCYSKTCNNGFDIQATKL